MIWYSIIILTVSFIGFWVAQKIAELKSKEETITCPVGFDCDSVLRSSYGKFFGIDNDRIGRYYYLAIASIYVLHIFIDVPQEFIFATLLASGLALLFSLYLIGVQLFALKKWCTWCLGSALINILLFVIIFIGFSNQFVEFLFNYRDLLSWVFGLALLIGTIVTTLHAFTFVRFLKDFEISKKEYRRLGMFSHTAWICLAFVFLTGLGLVLTDTYREITGNSEFLVMGVTLGVLVVYEFIQNIIIAPRLIDIHFGDRPKLDDEEHNYQRKIAFSFVSIGVLSWYMMMLFVNISWHEFDPLNLVAMYTIVLIAGVVVSLLVERVIYKKSIQGK